MIPYTIQATANDLSSLQSFKTEHYLYTRTGQEIYVSRRNGIRTFPIGKITFEQTGEQPPYQTTIIPQLEHHQNTALETLLDQLKKEHQLQLSESSGG